VLRGPQGPLYGASPLGGVVKHVTQRPDLEYFAGRAGATMRVVDDGGRAGHSELAAVNVPLAKGQLALRARYAEQTRPGWIDHSVLHHRHTNDVYQNAGRLSLLWKASDTVDVLLTAMRQENKADNFATVALDPVTFK
ncbi:hypothetical protein OEZ84_27825, partial [Leclercia adecarboxylata]|nr:hypothetical protein [Leclercia adecarboxylata]